MSPQIKPRRHAFEPHVLDADDEGFSAVDASAHVEDQDDAFCAAMRKAIKRKQERVREGIKVTDPEDARGVRPVSRGIAFVPSACSLENQ